MMLKQQSLFKEYEQKDKSLKIESEHQQYIFNKNAQKKKKPIIDCIA